jgi:PmbA protein
MNKIATIADQAQAAATALGIQKYDIFGSSIDETSVQVDEGQPDKMEASQRSSVTVRVWNPKGQIGIASTTDLDANGLKLALQTAFEASEFGATENVPDFSPEATAPIAANNIIQVPQATVQELLQPLLKAEKTLVEAHAAIAGVPYNGLAQSDSEEFYLNSAGAKRYQSSSTASVYLYTKTEQEGKKPRSAGAFRYGNGLAMLDVDACVKEAADKTISHLHYEKIPTGKYRVVFAPRAFLSLIGAFSNMFNAQSILDRQSLSTPDSLNSEIATTSLCLNDDALHPENVGVDTFDGEGTPTRQVPLITNGVLTSFLHSAGTAKRMATQPTGHANMGAKVTVSPNFYHVFASEQSGETYSLDEAENVILIDALQALHAGTQPLQGSFSLPFDGWLVNRGTRTSIDAATVAGDIREILKAIIYIEPEGHFTGSGVCPHVWVEGLSITGE